MRSNVLKVLSNKSCGLSIKNLTDVYNSLIRSLLDYSSILYPCFPVTNTELLEKIHKKSKYESNSIIRNYPGYISITRRFDTLNVNYIKKT